MSGITTFITPPDSDPRLATQTAGSDVFQQTFPHLDKTSNLQIRLLWIGCGASDPLLSVNRQFKDWLKARGVQFGDAETPGGHSFLVWRQNLSDFVSLLFRDSSR
jgi:enterochelin esterase-like enzyme